MTSATPTSVVNDALSEAFMDQIEDFQTDQTDVGLFLRQWWPVLFRESIDYGDWPIFRDVATLAPTSATTAEDGYYDFTLPDNFVRLTRILEGQGEFTITEDLHFRSESSSVKIEYLSDSKMYSPHVWVPTYVKHFRQLLVGKLHRRFDADRTKANEADEAATLARKEAQMILQQQQNRKFFTIPTWRGQNIQR